MNNRVLDGLACSLCGAEPAVMVPDGFGSRGQLFRCAECRPLKLGGGTDTTQHEGSSTLNP